MAQLRLGKGQHDSGADAANRIAIELEGALRLAEILGALSLTTDLGAGVPFEKGLRTCLVASGLAELLDAGLQERRDVYFAALLRSLGCTTHASLFAELFDDDVAMQRELKLFDLGGLGRGRRADPALRRLGRARARARADRPVPHRGAGARPGAEPRQL